MTKKRKGKRVASVECHRAMEGNQSMSICGVSYLAPYSLHAIGPVTTYDWRKVNCKTCLGFKHNYDGT